MSVWKSFWHTLEKWITQLVSENVDFVLQKNYMIYYL